MASDSNSVISLTRENRNDPSSAGKPIIWAFGGGKGGIGKSFITSNLSICLAQMGKRVIIVDLDLGGANVHTVLGGQIPKTTVSDFVRGRVNSLQEIVVESPVKNLSFISGAEDDLKIANLDGPEKEMLIRAIPSLKADYIMLDLGAGTANNTLDFFLMADRSFVVSTPEPTSIENAYRFIKSAFYRRLTAAELNLGIGGIVDDLMNDRSTLGIRTPADLVRHVEEKNSDLGMKLRSQLSDFTLGLIVNQVRTDGDRAVGPSMATVCKKYFGIPAEFLGNLEFDNAAWQALRRKRPIVVEYPSSNLSRLLYGLARSLVYPKPTKAVI